MIRDIFDAFYIIYLFQFKGIPEKNHVKYRQNAKVVIPYTESLKIVKMKCFRTNEQGIGTKNDFTILNIS